MIVSVREWTLLRAVRQMMGALTVKSPAEPRREESPKGGVISQFESMMAHHVQTAMRWDDN